MSKPTQPTAPEEAQDQGAAYQEFSEMRQYVEMLQEKLLQVTSDHREHKRVADTLSSLDGSKTAYRLIGDVLVKQTVAEVLPSLQETMKHLGEMADTLEKQLVAKTKELRDFQDAHQIVVRG